MNTFDYIVKKYNLNIDREYVVETPIIGAEGLSYLFADLGFKEGVEIGTDEGIYAEHLLETIPDLILHCIDPWSSSAYAKGEQPESFEQQEYFDKRYFEAQEKLSNYTKVDIIRETSEEALIYFEDNSLDFVYIDGNHDFMNVAFDIHNWTKKVKSGGIVSGHDYVRYPSRKYNHVQKVVNAYTQAYHLLPVFTVTPTDKGMKRDRFRSWFFVKK